MKITKEEFQKIKSLFFTSENTKFCKDYPDFIECEKHKNEFDSKLKAKGGCTPCRRRGLVKKYTNIIQSIFNND